MNYNQTGAKPIISMKWVIALTLLLTLVLGGLIASAQTVYNLDKADKVETKDTAIYNGKVYKVYANKKGRLYLETGKLTKAGKPHRKYITPATK